MSILTIETSGATATIVASGVASGRPGLAEDIGGSAHLVAPPLVLGGDPDEPEEEELEEEDEEEDEDEDEDLDDDEEDEDDDEEEDEEEEEEEEE